VGEGDKSGTIAAVVNALAKAGVEIAENGSVTPDQPKEKASEQFPPVRGFSLPRPPARIVNRRLDSYCVEKKEAPESTAENEEAPHGGERGF
jgi:hypothetical protein